MVFPRKLPSTQVRSRPPACHPFRGSSHPGKQLSAIFAGRPGGRLNTDHDFDTDRVGPSSGQPGNITPRGPSPPRIHGPTSAACTRVRPPHILLCSRPRLAALPSATALLPHHKTYISHLIHTTCPTTHFYTTTQAVHKTPCVQRARHTTASPLRPLIRTTHAPCT